MSPTGGASRLSDAAEAAVVALAVTGDARAFEDLVRRRQGMVRNLMRRLSGDPTLADDLAQQVFVQAWRTIGRLRAPGAFGGWLRRVAVNIWLQQVRRGLAPTLAMPDQPEAASGGSTPPLAAEVRIDLDRALSRLKPAERLCMVLSHGEGMSHGEIADATGWPLGTVKSHITRGLASLRATLKE